MADGQRSIVGKAWQYFKLAIGGLLVILPVFGMLAPESQTLAQFRELETKGVVSTAKVIDKIVQDNIPAAHMSRLGPVGGLAGGMIAGHKLSKAIDGESGAIETPIAVHTIKYEFRASDGKLIAGSGPVSGSAYDKIVVGSSLDVIHHPQQPNIHRLIDHSMPFQEATSGQTIGGLVLFGGLGVLLMWRNWPSRGSGSGSGGTGRAPLSTRAALAAPQASARPAMAGRPRRTGFGQR